MRKALQHALIQESGICHDQLQQALRHQVCQEEDTDAESNREVNQLQYVMAEQAETMKQFESQSQQFVSQQQEYVH